MLGLEILEFESDREMATLFGIFMAGMGAFLLIINVLLILTGGPAFFLILVVLLFCISSICFTGKATAKLDPNSGQLLKTTRVLFWAKSRLYDLSEFHAVGIREVMIGSAMHNNLSSFYYIQFIGKNRVSLPPVSCNIKQAREQLEEIARVVNLPSNTDSEP